MYSEGFSLGPHESEQALSRRKASSGPSMAKKAFTAVHDSLTHPHSISSSLILIALLSFVGNIAFAYIGFVRQGIDPEISFKSASAEQQRLGSDDGSEGQPPNFSPSVHFKTVENPSALTMSAKSYLVADALTGEIILEKDADTPYPMASVSKLLTAIVAREQIDSRHYATVTKEAYSTYGSEGELSTGEKILVSDLYYPLLIESSNDAAEVLADDFGRESFMSLLNGKTAELGMYSTYYDDPSGLSPKNVTTAHDLAKLGLYVFAAVPELLDITRVKEYSIYDHTWKNENVFLTYPNFLGGKNGFINEAKKTTLSYFKISFRGEDSGSKAADRPVIVVLLKSDDRDKDAAALLTYVAKNVRYAADAK